MGFQLVQKSTLIELDGTKYTWSLLTIMYLKERNGRLISIALTFLFCTEFQQKVFTLLESNAYISVRSVHRGSRIKAAKQACNVQVTRSRFHSSSFPEKLCQLVVSSVNSHLSVIWNSLPPSIVSFKSLFSFRNSFGNVNLGLSLIHI